MSLLSFLHRNPKPGETFLFNPLGTESEEALRLRNGRYATLVGVDATEQVDAKQLERAWEAVHERMALVPSGETILHNQFSSSPDQDLDYAQQAGRHVVTVAAVYMDRYAVTNADFARFVDANCYQNLELWSQSIWSQVIQFVDQSGKPGPRFWKDGRPPRDKMNHPVVGVSWFEADAFARWVGKELPSSSTWQRAGTWAGDNDSQRVPRFPWGEGGCVNRANTFSANRNDTVPVDEYYDGCTPNGIYQLVGNVWEWTATPFSLQPTNDSKTNKTDLGEIRGGAFDTYFESQASCIFRSGQPLLSRHANVGFRCCKPVAQMNIQS